MRLRRLAHFRHFQAIVGHPQLDRIISLPLPRRVRLGILEAFHALFVSPLEQPPKLEDAHSAFAVHIQSRVPGLLLASQPSEGTVALRLLAYQASTRGAPSAELLRLANDDAVANALLTRFVEARSQVVTSPSPRTVVAAPSDLPTTTAPVDPQSWSEWIACLMRGEMPPAQRFLDDRQPASADAWGATESAELAEQFERLLVESPWQTQPSVRQLLISGVPELLSECLHSPHYPQSEFAELFLSLHQLWAAVRQGSANPADAGVLLELAEAALSLVPSAEGDVADGLLAWWQARPAKVLVPFVLEAVELLDRFGAGTQRENLWLVAAEFVRRTIEELTPSERVLWRQIGQRIGLDATTLDQYVPLPPLQDEDDPLALADLNRITIVSLRERQAQEAGQMIRQRTKAEVFVVTSTHADSHTEAALNSDVVLLVWSAITHAVFRAFDRFDRDQLAYVAGTGAASIVRTLERWVGERTNR